MDSFSEYVRRFADLIAAGAAVPLPHSARAHAVSSSPAASPTALIFAPHPDDEVIIGALPLRLLRQSGWRVINVAVTLGSNRARQTQRSVELANCCRAIGFELVSTGPNGLENINPDAARSAGSAWMAAVETIRQLLESHQPRLVLFPHEADWNSTHVGVHHLLRQALAAAELTSPPWTCETEFWGQMPVPNLLVESSPEDLADLVSALACHVGEVERNPYHLTLPAWMMENVRRAELVVGQGKAVPDMRFGTIYRLGRWNGCTTEPAPAGRVLLDNEDPASLFPQ